MSFEELLKIVQEQLMLWDESSPDTTPYHQLTKTNIFSVDGQYSSAQGKIEDVSYTYAVLLHTYWTIVEHLGKPKVEEVVPDIIIGGGEKTKEYINLERISKFLQRKKFWTIRDIDGRYHLINAKSVENIFYDKADKCYQLNYSDGYLNVNFDNVIEYMEKEELRNEKNTPLEIGELEL